jgi:hypothetical protein
VRDEHRLELGRRHLVALVLDQLLEPVDDVEEPVLVDPADVAGAKPAVPDKVSSVAFRLFR